MKKICTACGKQYEAVSSTAKYCSDRCRKERRRIYCAAWYLEGKRGQDKAEGQHPSHRGHSSLENIRVINNYALELGYASYGKYLEAVRKALRELPVAGSRKKG